ncbi:MAG: hypothetical protein LRY20_01485, partial [Acholeplasmataceae bacterium]|nr:hypothetical protein [Acholeplasmataceae bacterium]
AMVSRDAAAGRQESAEALDRFGQGFAQRLQALSLSNEQRMADPSDRSLMNPSELEEERRIAYVGITRAKQKLYMSYADQRMVYGTMRYSYPSRFIQESRLRFDEPKIEGISEGGGHLLKTGDKVEHNAFGLGVVIRLDDDVATIAFGMPHGIKKILESHPALRKKKN